MCYATGAVAGCETGNQEPMKPSHLLRRFALVTLLALPALSLSAAVSGCKGTATAPAKSDSTAAVPRQAADNGERTGANLTPTRKGTGEGWRWKGKREACMFLVGKQCFDKREAACTAAGCGDNTCLASDAVPAQVSCKGAK
jgi:hypothetical protein